MPDDLENMAAMNRQYQALTNLSPPEESPNLAQVYQDWSQQHPYLSTGAQLGIDYALSRVPYGRLLRAAGLDRLGEILELAHRAYDPTGGGIVPRGTVRMEHMGDLSEASPEQRDTVRRMVSKANANPNEGPQDPALRIGAIRHRANIRPSYLDKQHDRITQMFEDGYIDLDRWKALMKPLTDAQRWSEAIMGQPGAAQLERVK